MKKVLPGMNDAMPAGLAGNIKKRYASGTAMPPLAADNGRLSGGLAILARDRLAGANADTAGKPAAGGTSTG